MINKVASTGKSKLTVRQLTTIGLLTGITIFLTATKIGFLPIPFLPVSPTILHIPVIIGALIEGPVVGLIVGLMFGISSIINSIVNPTVTSFVFWNPLVSIVPRLLIGLTTYYSFVAIKSITKNISVSVVMSALIGSFTNTILVLSLMYTLYADKLTEVAGAKAVIALVWGLVVTNGVPEAVVSAIITLPIVLTLKRIKK